MSREVVLYLRPLREGHGSAPALPWQESTHACERDAMAEIESPVVPMPGAWLARVDRTGARTRDGRGYTVREGVRAYVVRDGAAVPLPALHRRKGMASWLRTYGPDIVRAWETADSPSVMTDWLRAVNGGLRQRALDADTLADPAASCCAIREAVTVDEIALELERREVTRRIAASATIRQIEPDPPNATAMNAVGDVVSLRLAPGEVAMVEAGTPLYLGDDGTVRTRPSERAPEPFARAAMSPVGDSVFAMVPRPVASLDIVQVKGTIREIDEAAREARDAMRDSMNSETLALSESIRQRLEEALPPSVAATETARVFAMVEARAATRQALDDAGLRGFVQERLVLAAESFGPAWESPPARHYSALAKTRVASRRGSDDMADAFDYALRATAGDTYSGPKPPEPTLDGIRDVAPAMLVLEEPPRVTLPTFDALLARANPVPGVDPDLLPTSVWVSDPPFADGARSGSRTIGELTEQMAGLARTYPVPGADIEPANAWPDMRSGFMRADVTRDPAPPADARATRQPSRAERRAAKRRGR